MQHRSRKKGSGWVSAAPLLMAAWLAVGVPPAGAQTAWKGGGSTPKPPITVSPIPPEAERLAAETYRKLEEAERPKLLDAGKSLAERAAKLKSDQAAIEVARSEAQRRFSAAQSAASRDMTIAILAVGGLSLIGEDLDAWGKRVAASSTAPDAAGQSGSGAKATGEPSKSAAESAAPLRKLGLAEKARSPIKRLGKKKPIPTESLQRIRGALDTLLAK